MELKSKTSGETANIIPDKIIAEYNSSFTSNIKNKFKEKRGISDEIIKRFYIGYDLSMKRICIPIKNKTGDIVNIRKWSASTEPKMISYSEGFGEARLYPLEVMDNEQSLIICEGELDALKLLSEGYIAVTVTSGAGTWKSEFNKSFKEKSATICYDNDDVGRRGAEKVAKALAEDEIDVKIVNWNGQVPEKGDVTDYFVQGGTKEGFQALLDEAEPYHINETKIDWETADTKLHAIFPAQDYVNDTLYFASEIGQKVYIISSKRECFPVDDAENHGLKIRSYDKHFLMRFSSQAIRGYVECSKGPDPKELFNKVEKFIKRYVVLQDNAEYKLLSLWIMGSYIFRIFHYYPYIHLRAEKRSGKTRLLEVLEVLCFNGQLSLNHTEATIFRTIETAQPTMLLDEVENYGHKDKEIMGAQMAILRAGFSKSGSVPRCAPKSHEVKYFHCYSPKAFAGIEEIEDVLRDRVITIKMQRKLPEENTERWNPDKKMVEIKALRDDLYLFALEECKAIAKIHFKGPITDDSLLTDRELDIFEPLFSIASIIESDGNGILKVLSEFSLRSSKERWEMDRDDNETTIMFDTIREFIDEYKPDKEPCYYKTETGFEYFKSRDGWEWLKYKKQLSTRLKRIGIKIIPKRLEEKVERCYHIDREKLIELSHRYS